MKIKQHTEYPEYLWSRIYVSILNCLFTNINLLHPKVFSKARFRSSVRPQQEWSTLSACFSSSSPPLAQRTCAFAPRFSQRVGGAASWLRPRREALGWTWNWIRGRKPPKKAGGRGLVNAQLQQRDDKITPKTDIIHLGRKWQEGHHRRRTRVWPGHIGSTFIFQALIPPPGSHRWIRDISQPICLNWSCSETYQSRRGACGRSQEL